MNIKVHKEDMKNYLDIHGGECVMTSIEIYVDVSLDSRVQRNLVIHGVTENYFRSIDHDKVEEFTDLVADALDQLDD